MNRFITILIALIISFPSFSQGDKEQVLAAKVAYFTAEIGLTPEEAQVFWPIYNKAWDEIQQARRHTRHSLKAIREADAKGNLSEPEMKKLLNKYIADYKYEGSLQEIYLSEFYKILPTEKVAKIYLAEDGFRKKLTQMWKEQNQNRPKPDGKMVPPPQDKK